MQLASNTQSANVSEILAWTADRPADYKVPKRLTIVSEIPWNALGKIDRALLLTSCSRRHFPTNHRIKEIHRRVRSKCPKKSTIIAVAFVALRP
jgi:acyl-CoA synthetase (AMP-forming)/AMP-acid ligase II